MIVARLSADSSPRRTSISSSPTVAPGGRQRLHGAVVEDPDLPVTTADPDPGGVGGVLHHDGAGAGVGQDVGDLVGGGGLVDRDRDRAREPDGVVEQRPLVAGARQQPDPVAGVDARGDEALRDGRDLREELRGGDVEPPVSGAARERDRVRVLGRVADDVVGESATERHVGQRR